MIAQTRAARSALTWKWHRRDEVRRRIWIPNVTMVTTPTMFKAAMPAGAQIAINDA
jgi:hypothetical protein